MSAPREALEAKARQWLAFANEDLVLAEHSLLLGSSCPFHLVAYHCQQAAEKCLKAYLFGTIAIFRTHTIYRSCWSFAVQTQMLLRV